MQDLCGSLLLKVLREAVPYPNGTVVRRVELFLASQHTAIVGFESIIVGFVCQALGGKRNVVNTVSLTVHRL